MRTHRLSLRLICASIVVASASAVPLYAQTSTTTTTTTSTSTGTHETSRLTNEFTGLAGSTTNAQALVDGLRNGSPITLTSTSSTGATTTTTFTPDTGKLGYGNVRIALSLAQASLAQQGITAPTSAELAAALNGGTLVLANGTTVSLQGVLAARAAGEGWGQISNKLGFKLGELMRSPKTGADSAAEKHAHVQVARVEIASHVNMAHPDHDVNKPDIAQRPERADVPDRPERPDRPDHAGRPGG
ncbi:hypothetical protein [Dyella psychrodurans]|uniref:Uncharacterized protein n=1 Tax=Dyella psychrodurans TaxID=1927960 RepID=A0A370X0Y1_9GAMM|nr:hypothetical protein [Dyella psychrodurans]RDS82006.1 hypothetical protein DWU99_16490 [Dyella psychrodurans]